jgi:hypothetical protein
MPAQSSLFEDNWNWLGTTAKMQAVLAFTIREAI